MNNKNVQRAYLKGDIRECPTCEYVYTCRVKNPRQCPNCKRQIKYENK